MTPQLKEAIKTFVKVCLASVIPIVIAGLQNHQALADVGMAVLIALLMAINDYVRMHPEMDSYGVLPSAPSPE